MTPAELIFDRVDKIAPLLAGVHPSLQGIILADLLASWLAGHVVIAGGAFTDGVREKVLQHHLMLVRELVPLNEHSERIIEELNRACD